MIAARARWFEGWDFSQGWPALQAWTVELKRSTEDLKSAAGADSAATAGRLAARQRAVRRIRIWEVMGSLEIEDVLHVVEAGRFVGEPKGGADGTGGEGQAG